jgi:mono/diheme cytochrome c family protein
LNALIAKGGRHLTMPAWKGTLSESDIEALAAYVIDPKAAQPGAATLFKQDCATCHGDKVPIALNKESALKSITSGGAHITMPVWGKILTVEQLDALVAYTFDISKGMGIAAGELIFSKNCIACHGRFGQGGPNPARAGDIIPPISSAEFLKTRDDSTIRNIISQGQPNIGMSPFGDTNGGKLSGDEVDAVVAFIRGWQANPPSDMTPQAPPAKIPAQSVVAPRPSSGGSQGNFSQQILPIFQENCVMCHNSDSAIGGFDASSYKSIMAGGTDGPLVIAGNTSKSVLAQRIQGKGGVMPPSGQLPQNELQAILKWIAAGALNN